MPVTFIQRGDFKKLDRHLEKLLNIFKAGKLDEYGREGVAALAAATPMDSGKTARSWKYRIERSKDGVTLCWDNTNLNQGQSIAMLIQYGHLVWVYGSTDAGVYVEGVDYINPAIKPVMDKAVREITGEVMK